MLLLQTLSVSVTIAENRRVSDPGVNETRVSENRIVQGKCLFFYSKIFILKVQTVGKHNSQRLPCRETIWDSLFINSSTWGITLQKEFTFLQLHCENRSITSFPALRQKNQLIAWLTHRVLSCYSPGWWTGLAGWWMWVFLLCEWHHTYLACQWKVCCNKFFWRIFISS